MANIVIKYIKEDNSSFYGLDEEVRAKLTGLKLIEIWDGERHFPICQYTTADGSLTIEPRMEGGLEFVCLTAHPFPVSSHLWNGPDLIKNNQYRSMLASLFHDLIWEHRAELAKAWGVTEQDVLGWGDNVLYAVWKYASGDNVLGHIEARLAWSVCEFSKGWYHKVKKLLGLKCVVGALLLAAGCGTPPDWTVVEIEGTNAVLRAMGRPQTTEITTVVDVYLDASAKPWKDCKYSSNWNGSNASKRMMNLLSPKFSDAKVKEYLDWQVGIGCDHCHLFLVNQGDGEGAGYDALCDASDKAVGLKRVKQIRARGLGVVLWVVADDSDAYRKKVFADPSKYAAAMEDYFPYTSYVCVGLEMNEGEGSKAKWTALRDAIKTAGWTGPFATHHTSGKSTYASLGSIVMDQLEPSCTTADIAKSVKALKAKGYEVVGFEYSRGPDKAKAQAALDAGAFGCGNWKGSGPIVTAATASAPAVAETATTATGDAVDYSALKWEYGGFNGSKAKPVDGVRIKDLKVTNDKVSYAWASGGCEKLGASSREDPACIAAFFCLVDGQWIGGR